MMKQRGPKNPNKQGNEREFTETQNETDGQGTRQDLEAGIKHQKNKNKKKR